jgi:hypothetical protein
VKSIATNAGGSTVKVHYPTPPDPPGRDELYDVADPYLRRFENAMDAGGTCDVVCDPTTGAVTSVTAKK